MEQTADIRLLNEKIEKESAFTDIIRMEMNKVIIGQKHLVDSLMIGLLANGHILLEGVPGLAKTLTIKSLASIIDARFSRIQFTPDLLPADLIGTMIYSQKKEEFIVKKGPVFANFILADEINRSPAKVQSALLEAMQERQVTIGDTTFKLDEPFLVMNGDILSLINLSDFYNFAINTHTLLTIAIKKEITPFAFGNIYFKGDFVEGVEEKPDIVMYILAGIYIMKPEILSFIPENTSFGMDKLIKNLLIAEQKVAKYDLKEYWLDIGRINDYEKAQVDFKNFKE